MYKLGCYLCAIIDCTGIKKDTRAGFIWGDSFAVRVLKITPISSVCGVSLPEVMGVKISTHNKCKVACLWILILVSETIELPL